MSTPERVEAMWVGPHDASLPSGERLEPGVTVVAMPRGEAEQSEHWQVLGPVGGGDEPAPEAGADEGDEHPFRFDG